MLRPLAVLLVVGFTVYTLVDCLRTDGREIQGLPKPVWLLVILLLPLFGPLAWVLLGRTRPTGPQRPVAGRGPAPDDDPEFLRQIERRRQQAEAERLKRWEEDLRRREQDGSPGDAEEPPSPTR